MINLKDANGRWQCIREDDLLMALIEADVTIYGFPIHLFAIFKETYDAYGGTYPATEKSIRAVLDKRR